MPAKYIRDAEDNIIVFSDCLSHSTFKHLKPLSAGFIWIGLNSRGRTRCVCYGASISLNLKSDLRDAERAMRQILGYEAYELKENMEI